ncbi:serine/threonine-protein kinase [Gordonia sp. (in: high G+C Gram-positive bacteria)]|uniref:serine/threonine-protein kinase n=1 Tax=Gordonia sp. (in: high G+C Gram-positive bacteria) TaxID=84139 RepID=UPI0016968294|nr:serine/threonine-protein kinase [Gordonia sp. (in: high G+C Gram-positive bacteria)]NLG45972.1 serine/threonine protein kinase [Gordonia sp. (in: high G+C Gram-positive bacteria)]
MTSSAAAPGPTYLVAGRYRLSRKIGHGGMGAVWLAHDQLLDREVAVKQVLVSSGMDDSMAETSRARALREGRLAARLSHRNAISMHDVALHLDEPWLVMEYLPSHSVADVLRDNGTIDPVEAAQICAQVADAIAEAHASGIIHRDIKPANILIANSGRNVGLVKITDFGISRAKGDANITQTGIVTGTPAYFAPEVARGEDPGEPSDVYSLGATLYTMVEGAPPFGNEDNYIATLHRAALGKINPITRAGALSPILLHLLEPSPNNRPTMADARDQLAQFAADTLGTTDNVLTGLVTTKPLHNRRADTLPPAPQGPPTPSPRTPSPRTPAPMTAVSMTAAPESTPPHRPTQVAANGYYAPRTTPQPLVHQQSGPSHPVHYTPQPRHPAPQQSGNNAGLAAAVFAIFVLLTAIAAGIIILAL